MTYKGFAVPRPGIEPGWIAPLVFETSASTDSAIWAHVHFVTEMRVQRYDLKSKSTNFFRKIFCERFYSEMQWLLKRMEE